MSVDKIHKIRTSVLPLVKYSYTHICKITKKLPNFRAVGVFLLKDIFDFF